MTQFAVGQKARVVDVTLIPSMSMPGYSLGYLDVAQRQSLGLPHKNAEYAIRVDGSRAELVKLVNGYTSRIADAVAA